MGLFEDALTNGGAGALIGGAVGGPVGAGIGAGAGSLFGLYTGYKRGKAYDQQRKGIDQVMAQLGQQRQQAWDQRMGDLDKIMAFYGPANNELQRLYGTQIPVPKMAGTKMPGGGMG
jgi:hypothetical protein